MEEWEKKSAGLLFCPQAREGPGGHLLPVEFNWNCLNPKHEGHRCSEGLVQEQRLKEEKDLNPTAPQEPVDLMPPPPENPP